MTFGDKKYQKSLKAACERAKLRAIAAPSSADGMVYVPELAGEKRDSHKKKDTNWENRPHYTPWQEMMLF